MPGCGIHLLIASRQFGQFSDASRDALLAGCLAPDLGYFPGGNRFLSDLAHHVHSGRLTRALVHQAEGEIERAFSLGWATHVVADCLIHPIINPLAADYISHIRVEQGLDAVIAARTRAAALWPPRNSLPPAVVALLIEAYRKTYGIAIARKAMEASSRALCRGVPRLLKYGQAVAGRFGEPEAAKPSRLVRMGLDALRLATVPFRGSALFALARPIHPADAFLHSVMQAMDQFPSRFESHHQSQFATLPDLNLDTGEPEAAPHMGAAATRNRLASRKKNQPHKH